MNIYACASNNFSYATIFMSTLMFNLMGVFLPHVIYLLSHSPSNEKNETYRSLIKKTKQETNINSNPNGQSFC